MSLVAILNDLALKLKVIQKVKECQQENLVLIKANISSRIIHQL